MTTVSFERQKTSYLQVILKVMLDKAYSSMENTGNLFVLFKSLSQFIPKQQRKEIVKAVHNI